jgi:hypothetical protein
MSGNRSYTIVAASQSKLRPPKRYDIVFTSILSLFTVVQYSSYGTSTKNMMSQFISARVARRSIEPGFSCILLRDAVLYAVIGEKLLYGSQHY